MEYPQHYPDFFTATILEWKPLLQQDKFKEIIINSLRFLVEDKRVTVFGFVIMSNHIHIIWRAANNYTRTKIQQSFMKYTAQIILKELRNSGLQELERYYVGTSDRKYQIWERNPLSIEIRSNEVMFQKLNYIHLNPVRAGICKLPEEYLHSSASLYAANKMLWNFVTKWEID
jgi:REP element-mobilizing transposase RayT